MNDEISKADITGLASLFDIEFVDGTKPPAWRTKIMTPQRLTECLAAIGWSKAGLAARLDQDINRIRRWANGEYQIPTKVGKWLERIATVHERNAPPTI